MKGCAKNYKPGYLLCTIGRYWDFQWICILHMDICNGPECICICIYANFAYAICKIYANFAYDIFKSLHMHIAYGYMHSKSLHNMQTLHMHINIHANRICQILRNTRSKRMIRKFGRKQFCVWRTLITAWKNMPYKDCTLVWTDDALYVCNA